MGRVLGVIPANPTVVNGWVHKRCFGVKSHLRTICGIFRCKKRTRGNHDYGTDIDVGINFGNWKYLKSWKILLCGRGVKGKLKLN